MFPRMKARNNNIRNEPERKGERRKEKGEIRERKKHSNVNSKYRM